ncbi:MAG: biotin transporter BioY [Acidimicrobiia bacterium]
MYAPSPALTLSGLLPTTKVRTVALVVAAAALTALAAQISVPIPGTPVPVTLQTFTVVLVGAGLGWKSGLASQLLYVMVGAMGAPIYAGGEGGWTATTSHTAGYLVGFVVAATVAGALAERGQDRRILTAIPAMAIASVIIWAFGATWLAYSLSISPAAAISAGVTPFILGDAIKMLAAGLVLPAAWRLVESRR